MDENRDPLRTNVELKARIDRPDEAVRTCERLGALERLPVDQTDTYFTLGNHRLKLRESSDGENVLIGYSRPDVPEARRSQYRITRIDDAGATKAALTRQWGVKAVVRKRRRLFLWRDRVRIHLDVVHLLGEYLELEAVVGSVPGYDEDTARGDVERLACEFGLTQRDLVARSYASLVATADSTPAGT